MKHKKKVFFLFPYPYQTAASQRFRFEQYLSFLAEKNLDYELHPFLDEEAWDILYKKGRYIQKIWAIVKGFWRRGLLFLRANQADIIFVHREASPLGYPVFEYCWTALFQKKMIFDFDDAIWLPNTGEENKWAASLKFHQKTALICRRATVVSAGNAYLRDFAARFNARVLIMPTTIDTEHLHNRLQEHFDLPLSVGWTGTHSTLPYLDPILPVLQKLRNEQGTPCVVIANRPPEPLPEGFVFKKWNKASEIEDLLSFQIGLMPLKDDPWARGKCGFKALQYMALGMPVLLSPVGVNTEIVRHGQEGFYFNNNEELTHYLKILLNNPELCKQMGQKACLRVKEVYSVKSQKERFLGLFDC